MDEGDTHLHNLRRGMQVTPLYWLERAGPVWLGLRLDEDAIDHKLRRVDAQAMNDLDWMATRKKPNQGAHMSDLISLRRKLTLASCSDTMYATLLCVGTSCVPTSISWKDEGGSKWYSGTQKS
jgi:hypothetical protein